MSFSSIFTAQISIHPPRAGWDLNKLIEGRAVFISIHPPRAGWDGKTSITKI